MSFADDLARYGPDSTTRLSVAESRAYCARLAAAHYENFSVVSVLTPREWRADFEAIYAFCRWSDDLGDEVLDAERSLELLSWWRSELRDLYRGRTRHPVMTALAGPVDRRGIPIEPFEALISAFEQDQRITRYDTYEQLLDYCVRSANPVGELVLYVWGAHEAGNVVLSDRICTGLQLANFWQDVARDYGIGRVYLPRVDLSRFGVGEEEIAERRVTDGFRRLLEFEVMRARGMLMEGGALSDRLTGRAAMAIELFRGGGLAILGAIERARFDVLSERPVVSRGEKLGLVWSVLGRSWKGRRRARRDRDRHRARLGGTGLESRRTLG
jgi:squalene synthase HpnC